MATRRWLGAAGKTPGVYTVTITSNDATSSYRLTVNGKVVSALGNSGGTSNTATDLANAWNGSAEPEIKEGTASATGSTVTITGPADGTPLTITSSVSGGGGTIGAVVTATAATGPSSFINTANWSGSTVPITGDDVVFDIPNAPLLYDLAQSGITLNSLTVLATFSGSNGRIGLPETNSNGSTPYFEYRTTYLQISATTVNIGTSAGQGSDRIKLDTGTNTATVNVFQTGSSPDADLEAILYKGNNASNTLNVTGNSSVGVAVLGGETANVPTINLDGNAQVRCGSGVTLTTVNTSGNATLQTNSAIGTALTALGGNVTLNGTGNVAQLSIRDANVVYNTSGTLNGNTTVSGSGILDFNQDPRTKSLTNPIVRYGTQSQVIDPNKVVTGGGGFVVDLKENSDLSGLNIGSNIRITRGTPA